MSEKIGKKIGVGRLCHVREAASQTDKTRCTVKNLVKQMLDEKPNNLFASLEAVIDTHRTLIRSGNLNIKVVPVNEAHCVVKW